MQKMNSNDNCQHTDNCQLERIDELERYYKPIESLDYLNQWLFWCSALLSILVFFGSQIPWIHLQGLFEELFVVLVLVHLVISLYIRYNLFPIAERKRRQQLLSDSFAVPLISESTQKYYNNEISPSLERLGANVLENALFTKTICSKMAIRERIKILLFFVVWILAILCRSTDLGLLVIITQTLFSSEIVENWIRIEVLSHQTAKIYDEIYNLFLLKVDFDSTDGIASILEKFASYEANKSRTSVILSRSIFLDTNSALSQEWDLIRRKLGISKEKGT